MARMIEDGGKAYLVDDNGHVIAAADRKEDLLPETPRTIAVGDRVEADGKLGKVAALFDDMYGRVASVRLDGGDYASYYVEDLKHSDEEPTIQYESATARLLAEAKEYEEMASDTVVEIEEKARVARALNLRAKALCSDSKLPLSDRANIGMLVTATATDLLNLKDAFERVRSAPALAEIEALPRYAVEVGNGSEFSRGDTNWLSEEAENMPEYDWETLYAQRAAEIASGLSQEQTEDEEFVAQYSKNAFFATHGAAADFETHYENLMKHVKTAVGLQKLGVGNYDDPYMNTPVPSGDQRYLPMDAPSSEVSPIEEPDYEDIGSSSVEQALMGAFADLQRLADGTIVATDEQGNQYEINVKHLGLSEEGVGAQPVEEGGLEPVDDLAPLPEDEYDPMWME